MTSKVTSLGMFGAAKHVRSTIDIRILNGIIYIEIVDSASGANTRTAKISLSPDKMAQFGRAMADIGDGGALDDVDHAGFNRVAQTLLKEEAAEN